MADTSQSDTLAQKAQKLRNLHQQPGMVVLPNAWDAATARVFEAAGFPAIATTSWGVAEAVGYGDHEQAPPEEMFAAARRITRSVSIPVTVDLEAGYGLAPEHFVERALEAGAAGFNFEDTDHKAGNMRDLGEQVRLITALRRAVDASGVPLVINARTDAFVLRQGTKEDQISTSIDRGNRYLEAGADCVYPIGLLDETAIQVLVEAIHGPINIMKLPNTPSLAHLAEIGVKRVTYASMLYRQLMSELERTAAAIKAEMPANISGGKSA